ncbi:MAG: 6-carboxytetrahydropterin synthase QueD [Bacteroidetes bacterium HGW-Bacteroidetes-6]|jgi:6-pyruvoyltetrahydropterin/6-carboxytetrahydropterin synthase|nr:MAG: 6-carboxytetrahydropterin synthase QueD [Bacteroidetes bacterium HGW-Bacteroidetes-6]
MNIRLTKEFTFEMAHALAGYDGACRHIHGHSFQLKVTVVGKPKNDLQSPKDGMLIDFGDLKRLVKENIIDQFDHALVINKRSKNDFAKMSNTEVLGKIVYVSFQPTSENLLGYFVSILQPLIPEGVFLHSLLLRETGTSYAEWYADDNR